MADVMAGPPTPDWVDDYLTYLFREWAAMPQFAAEWAEWDEDDRFVYAEGWGVPPDRLLTLRRWAAQGHLSPEQKQRYEELERLVDKHLHLLAEMLGEESAARLRRQPALKTG